MDFVYNKLSLCSNLEALDLTSNFEIIYIPFLAKLNKLTRLSIEWCINIDPESSTVILSDESICPNLKHLSLRRCEQFSFWDILRIVSAHPTIQTLNVSFTSVIDEECVSALNSFFPYIQNLILSPHLESHNIE